MLIDADLPRAEEMIKDIESFVQGGVWHSGRNLQAVSEMTEVDDILNEIEQSAPSTPIKYYLEQLERALNLRKRWLRLKDEWPPNPFGSTLANWHWKLLDGAAGESERAAELQVKYIILKAVAQASSANELTAEKAVTTPQGQTPEPTPSMLASAKKALE